VPREASRAPACSVNVHFCLIEAVEVEGFGGGGVVAPAFGDVQVAGVLMAARMVARLAGPPAGDLDGLAGAGEVQSADVGGLQGAGLDAAVPGIAGRAVGRYLPPGQGLDPGRQQRLVSSPRRCNGLCSRLPASSGSPAPYGGRRRSPRHRPGPGGPGAR
jgi:hypothetical protein